MKETKKILKIVAIVATIFIFTIVPILGIFAPAMYLGNLFSNAWSSLKDFFSNDVMTYEGVLTEDLDNYVYENRISLDYDQIMGCVLYDLETDPITDCLDKHDDNGNINSKNANNNDFKMDWKEYKGRIDDSYYNEIHVLGKYNTHNWEKVGEHKEKHTSTSKVCKKWNYTSRGDHCSLWKDEEITTEEIVDDYNWVYHPEIKRGKCIESDTQKCNIILEDKDVYPYQEPTFSLSQHYGGDFDKENFDLTISKYQIWTGNLLYAFSKATITEIDSSHILLDIMANDIDLFALYEVEDDSISSEFGVGDIVEATEQFALCDSNIKFSVFNSEGLYYNPAVFVSLGATSFANLGTIIYGFENFAPDFKNTYAWKTGNGYYTNWCGQCTWFAKGMFIQIYGFDPKFTGNGNVCASQAHKFLSSQGWTLTKSPSPGAIFSKLGGKYGHVGIVCGVNEDNSIVVVDGNYDGENNTFEEFISLPDWGQRIIPYAAWKDKYEFCNPPQ